MFGSVVSFCLFGWKELWEDDSIPGDHHQEILQVGYRVNISGLRNKSSYGDLILLLKPYFVYLGLTKLELITALFLVQLLHSIIEHTHLQWRPTICTMYQY